MESKEQWFELKVTLKSEWKDPISSKMFELGAQGVVEDTGFVSGYFPESIKATSERDWKIYLTSLCELSPEANHIAWTWVPVPEINWVDKYKETFKAQRLTDLFFLQPAWDKESKIPYGMIPIRMELGQAFGTGLHASTRLALRLLQNTVDKFMEPSKISLLDVGTGTGILAIGAEMLGIKKIFANDIDEVSVEVAKENLVANQCKQIELSTRPIEAIKTSYDIVVANILLETHKQLQPHYSHVCKRGGFLILSGFLSNQVRAYFKWLKNNDEWKVLEECHLQDWGACILGRR